MLAKIISPEIAAMVHAQKTLTSLRDYHNYLIEWEQLHAGYPVNLRFDYSTLFPFLRFSLNNAGDPFITRSGSKLNSHQFEQEVLTFFAKLYKAEDWWGYVTTGGTEGNFYGLLLGREAYPDGILYASDNSHYSVAKAARILRIEQVVVRSQSNGEIDYEDLSNKLNTNHPVIINLNIGTTFKGATDNLDQILEILAAREIEKFHIHCDGALGGMLLPYSKPDWMTFNRPIHSLAISGHKFIGCPFPCGIVLTRKPLVDQLASSVEYIGSKDTTIGGSRSGHAPLFLWYAIQQRGNQFEQEARECLAKAAYFHRQLKGAGLDCLLNPYSSTVVFPKPGTKVVEKWQLATQGNLAHAVIMQNHSYELLDCLLANLLKSN